MLAVYRREWHGSVFSAFIQPLVVLAGLGIGLGVLVGDKAAAITGGVSYVAYIAPALMISAAMELAASEAAWPILARVAWVRIYHAIVATPLNAAFLFALAAAALVWALIWRTRWGYALRVVGQNESAAVYAGITPSRVVIGAMLLSGALAGCFGLNELLGAQHRILIDFPGGAGFVGIAVALMGRNHPAGIMGAAVLFGALYQGGSQLSFDLPKLNRDMVVVIQGLVILFCGAMENVFRAPLARLLAIFQPGEGGR